MCEKHNVEFKNQTFPSFINELKNNNMNKKTDRIEFTYEKRQELLNKFKNKCNICKDQIKIKFEIDHILPLAANGTNEDNNLQVLCKSCHKDKTQSKNEDGTYVRIVETESTFNNQVQEIMDSDLSFRYASIEHIKSLPKDEDIIDHKNSNLEQAKQRLKKRLSENNKFKKLMNREDVVWNNSEDCAGDYDYREPDWTTEDEQKLDEFVKTKNIIGQNMMKNQKHHNQRFLILILINAVRTTYIMVNIIFLHFL